MKLITASGVSNGVPDTKFSDDFMTNANPAQVALNASVSSARYFDTVMTQSAAETSVKGAEIG